MATPKVIHNEAGRLFFRYLHPKCDETLGYDYDLAISESGKAPVEMRLKFKGIYPYVAPMPPEEISIKAKTVGALFEKVVKSFRKHGYELI